MIKEKIVQLVSLTNQINLVSRLSMCECEKKNKTHSHVCTRNLPYGWLVQQEAPRHQSMCNAITTLVAMRVIRLHLGDMMHLPYLRLLVVVVVFVGQHRR